MGALFLRDSLFRVITDNNFELIMRTENGFINTSSNQGFKNKKVAFIIKKHLKEHLELD